MNDKKVIQTGFRVSDVMNDEIEELAADFDISKNALMTMAMRIGLNNLKDLNQSQGQQE